MSHPYGKKAEVTIMETCQKVMEGSGSPLTALHYHGRPYKVAERIVTMLMERRYCMPGDVLMWAISYRRNQQPFSEQDKKMLIKIEIEGDGNGVSVCSD